MELFQVMKYSSQEKSKIPSLITCFYNPISAIKNMKYCDFLIYNIQFVENS